MGSLLDKLKSQAPEHVGGGAANVADWQTYTSTSGGPFNTPKAKSPVTTSSELDRVIAITRRMPVDLESSTKAAALVALVTERLARKRSDRCACASMGRPCIVELKAAQAWALFEAPLAGGLVGNIGVGHGKTGLDILAPLVMPGCKLAVLLIPPGLREQLIRDYLAWREHFRVPSLVMGEKGYIVPGAPVLHVVPYSRFSRPESTELLEQLKPDLVIGDEAHNLRHPDTARTGRVLRYFIAHPETRLCVWSGTLAASSIKNFAHLSALALGESSPLPIDPEIVDEWAAAIDPSDWPAPAGALRRLLAPGETLYQAMHRRIVETRGVVSTRAGAIDASINIFERHAPAIPAELQKLLRDLRTGWIRPDGEELIDALSVARCARELACGFYYRWKFPHGEPVELINEWFAARKAWYRELREKLKTRAPHMDSPLLCAKAAIRAYQVPAYDGDLPVWPAVCWPAWRDIRDRVYHETEAVWCDDYLARDAAKWATSERGIVWYEHEAFGRRVSEISGLPLHGGGPGAEERILAETGKRSIIASIKSHGTGRDGLQRVFRAQLVANPPASGDAWEQLLGRLHRIGQAADEVDSHVYRHTAEMADAIDRALIHAKFVEGVMGTHQKLLAATCDFRLDSV